jgi:LmbE family N-acetylglucosaminyl deacetylase
VYCFWSNQPNAWVDVGSVLERKIDALRAHASQIREPEALAERIRAWMAEEGEPIGVAAAEALRLIVIDDDDDEGGHAADEATSGQAGSDSAASDQAAR